MIKYVPQISSEFDPSPYFDLNLPVYFFVSLNSLAVEAEDLWRAIDDESGDMEFKDWLTESLEETVAKEGYNYDFARVYEIIEEKKILKSERVFISINLAKDICLLNGSGLSKHVYKYFKHFQNAENR